MLDARFSQLYFGPQATRCSADCLR